MDNKIKTVEYIKPLEPQPTPEEYWKAYRELEECPAALDDNRGVYKINERKGN